MFHNNACTPTPQWAGVVLELKEEATEGDGERRKAKNAGEQEGKSSQHKLSVAISLISAERAPRGLAFTEGG